MNKKMGVMPITLFLLIAVTIAKEVDINQIINPLKEVDIGKVINPTKDAGIGKAINDAEDYGIRKVINPAREANIGEGFINPAKEEADIYETINLTLNYSQPHAYESPKFKSYVMHCSSHIVDTCSSGTTLHHKNEINHPHGLALCLFDSMERCLVDHGASFYQATSTSTSTSHQDPQFNQIKPYLSPLIRPLQIPIPMPIPLPPTPRIPPIPLPPMLPINPPLPIPRPPNAPKSNIFSFTSKDNHQDPRFNQIKRHLPPLIRPLQIPIPMPIPLPPTPRIPPIPLPPMLPINPPLPIPRPPNAPKSNIFSFTSKDNHQNPNPNVLPETRKTIQYQSILIETLKFQIVLRTCTHFSAQNCYTGPNVAKFVLANCLIPSLNQCVYPDAATPGNPPDKA